MINMPTHQFLSLRRVSPSFSWISWGFIAGINHEQFQSGEISSKNVRKAFTFWQILLVCKNENNGVSHFSIIDDPANYEIVDTGAQALNHTSNNCSFVSNGSKKKVVLATCAVLAEPHQSCLYLRNPPQKWGPAQRKVHFPNFKDLSVRGFFTCVPV